MFVLVLSKVSLLVFLNAIILPFSVDICKKEEGGVFWCL